MSGPLIGERDGLRCIFCLQERAPSEEHVFPDAIGGTLTTDRVCKPCNDRLGSSVDKLLTEHGFVVMRRHSLGMRDSRGNAVSPWGKVLRSATIGEAPELPFELIAEPKTGKITHRVLYRRDQWKDESGREVIQVTIDGSRLEEVPKIIERERRRAGLPDLSTAQMEEQVAKVVADVKLIERPSISLYPSFDTERFTRALLKIAYELAWLWLGDAYLDDPMAERLRRAVIDADTAGVQGTSFLGAASPEFAPWATEPDSHMGLGVCSADGRSMAIAIRIFEVLSGVFQVTECAASYASSLQGGFVMTGPGTPVARQSTFFEEMRRVAATGFRAPS